MTAAPIDWPETHSVPPPADHLYTSAAWLLGRHPRLAHLAARVAGVIHLEDGELSVDLDHLADVISATKQYDEAWEKYERRVPPPQDDRAYDAWVDAGPKADDITRGLADFLVMSSGETASLRLLATLASLDCAPPFSAYYLRRDCRNNGVYRTNGTSLCQPIGAREETNLLNLGGGRGLQP